MPSESNRCPICRHGMKVVDGKLRCYFCEEFYCYDMAKEWIDFIWGKEHEKEPKKSRRR